MQTRHRVILSSIAVIAMAIGHGRLLAAQGQVVVERIAPGVEFERIINSVLGADGRICVADDLAVKVTCLAPDGVLLWSYGRKGGGPGEFRGIYRLALAPDLTVFVADGSTGELHRLSSSGAYLGKTRFPGGFGQMGSLVALSRDTIAVSGTLYHPESARSAAIHVFVVGDTIAYLRSFGDLHAGADPEKSTMTGPGPVTRTTRGTLLYSQRFPYAVIEYTVTGTKLRSAVNAMQTFNPDDATSIERAGSRVTYRVGPPPAAANIVMAAREIGNGSWWVARRVGRGRQFFDIVDPTSGRWKTPVSYPSWDAMLGIFGEDRKRGVFIASTLCDEEPCLVRFPSRPFLGR